MGKFFDFINFGLVTLLGVLCLTQWSHEREYARQFTELRQTATSQADKIAVQTESLQQANQDLEGFKQEITTFKQQADDNTTLIRQQKGQIFQLQEDNTRTTHQLADWQKAVDEYKSAVTTRDDNIKTLLKQREELVTANKDVAAKANEAVLAYNNLTGKYEDLVTKYNSLATRYTAEQDAAAAAAAQAGAK
jgi:chromosome segregation ATPase